MEYMTCVCPHCRELMGIDDWLECRDFGDYVNIAVVDHDTIGITVYATCEHCHKPVEVQYLMHTGDPEGVIPDGYEEE